MNELRPFHIAFPVTSLDKARAFYGGILECPEARSTDNWVDFDLYGNSLSAYLHEEEADRDIPSNLVDTDEKKKKIPVRHFGIVLEKSEWEKWVEKLKNKSIEFIIGPVTRFPGRNGEQSTIYFNDNCGNVVEFKTFHNPETRFRPFDN